MMAACKLLILQHHKLQDIQHLQGQLHLLCHTCIPDQQKQMRISSRYLTLQLLHVLWQGKAQKVAL